MVRVEFSQVPGNELILSIPTPHKRYGQFVFFKDGYVGLWPKNNLLGHKCSTLGFNYCYCTGSQLAELPGVKLFRPDGFRIAKGLLRNPRRSYYIDYDCKRVVAVGFPPAADRSLPVSARYVPAYYTPEQDVPHGRENILLESPITSHSRYVEWFEKVHVIVNAKARMLIALADENFMEHLKQFENSPTKYAIVTRSDVLDREPEQFVTDAAYDFIAAVYLRGKNAVKIFEQLPYMLIE